MNVKCKFNKINNVPIYFQILSLEGLAIYWNPATTLYTKLSATEIKNNLETEIATKTWHPESYKYGKII